MPASPPDLTTPHAPEEVATLLESTAKRGKLPGFERGSNGELFRVALFSEPFDHDLIARVAEHRPTRLTFEVRLRRMLPIVIAVVVALTIWPGVSLMHSLLVTYFEWYRAWCEAVPGLTYWWYLPLSILPLPWVYKGIVRKVKLRLAESIERQMVVIRETLGATES